MSIVNEALKKASKESGKDNTQAGKRVVFLDKSRSNSAIVIIGAVIIILVLALFLLKGRLPLYKGKGVPKPVAETAAPSAETAQPLPSQPSSADLERDAVNRHKRALELYKEKRLAEAMAELLIAISIKPDMASAHNNLGLIYKESGRYKEAEKEYKEALRIDQKYVGAMNNLAVLYDYEGKHTEAAELLKKAVDTAPNNAVSHLNYAVTLERLGRIEEAKSHYKSYLKLLPEGDKGLRERIKKHLNNLQVKKK